MDNKIKAFMRVPNDPYGFFEITIPNRLEVFQALVDGYIETVTIGAGVVAVCNEEGRLRGLPHCCDISGIGFVGNVLLVGVLDEDFADCPLSLESVRAIT